MSRDDDRRARRNNDGARRLCDGHRGRNTNQRNVGFRSRDTHLAEVEILREPVAGLLGVGTDALPQRARSRRALRPGGSALLRGRATAEEPAEHRAGADAVVVSEHSVGRRVVKKIPKILRRCGRVHSARLSAVVRFAMNRALQADRVSWSQPGREVRESFSMVDTGSGFDDWATVNRDSTVYFAQALKNVVRATRTLQSENR